MSVEVRVLTIIRDHLLTHCAGIKTAGIDFVDWDSVRDFPAAFVVPGSGGGLEEQAMHNREELPISLWGYVRSDTGTPDGVTAAREPWFRTLTAALRHPDLQRAFTIDAADHGGNGCTRLSRVAGPRRDDGLFPPFGIVRIPLVAILHLDPDAQ